MLLCAQGGKQVPSPKLCTALPCFAQYLAIAFRDLDAYGAHTNTPLYVGKVSGEVWIIFVFFPSYLPPDDIVFIFGNTNLDKSVF